MSSRKALRDFYKLQRQEQAQPSDDNAVEEPNSDALPAEEPAIEAHAGLLADEEEPLTALTELDDKDADISEFVRKLAAENSLTSFVATAHQISREQATLTSAQRELVNDNYKKLIQAAETLGYLSAQGDLVSLDSLASSVEVIADVTRNIAAGTPADTTELRAELRRKLTSMEPAEAPSKPSI